MDKSRGQLSRKLTCEMTLYAGKDDGYRLHPHLISRYRGEGRSCRIELTLSAIQP